MILAAGWGVGVLFELYVPTLPGNLKKRPHFSVEVRLPQHWAARLGKRPLSKVSSRRILGATTDECAPLSVCSRLLSEVKRVEAEAATNSQWPHRSLIVCLHNKSNVSREIIYTGTVLNK